VSLLPCFTISAKAPHSTVSKHVMNGCTIPYTPIAVDFWKPRKCSKVNLFFLSHVQLDQSCGLSSNWTLPIYCSPVSKKLLIHLYQVRILNFYRGLPITCLKGYKCDDISITSIILSIEHDVINLVYFMTHILTRDFKDEGHGVTTWTLLCSLRQTHYE